MSGTQILLGLAIAAFVFGAYFRKCFMGGLTATNPRKFFREMLHATSRRGLVWSIALPACWVVLFYTFVIRVWFANGRWPKFGEKIDGLLISAHDETVRYLLGALVGSLCFVPVIGLVCLALRRWRQVSVYTITYAAAVGLAACCLMLAPHAFLNWFFD
jgi:hypothetical protein